MPKTNLHSVTVPMIIKHLRALKMSLQKTQEYVDSKKLSWTTFDEAILHDRLIFDQFPLLQQVQIACDNAKGGVARLAQVDIPVYEDTEKTFQELYARIDKTLAFIDTITPEQIAGKEDIRITLPYYPDQYLTGFDYATQQLIPNFLFHVVTAYSIMRKNGVPLGKQDYMGTVPWRTS